MKFEGIRRAFGATAMAFGETAMVFEGIRRAFGATAIAFGGVRTFGGGRDIRQCRLPTGICPGNLDINNIIAMEYFPIRENMLGEDDNVRKREDANVRERGASENARRRRIEDTAR